MPFDVLVLVRVLRKGYIGALGLIVLLSSLIRQHWRPDVQYVGARQRSQALKELIRKVNDRLDTDRMTGAQTDKTEIVEWLSDGITAVERSDIEESGNLADTVISQSNRRPLAKGRKS